MFIGHYGVALAAKKIDKKPSLGTLFLASEFIDLLWPLFLLLGIEKVKIDPGNTAITPLDFIYYPFSHSLVGVIIWTLLFGVVYFLIKKNFKTSILLGALVLSHWILDFITHRPDLQLFPWSDLRVGLGLWYSIPFTILIEGLIFIAGIFLYLKSTKAVGKKGTIIFWCLIIFLSVIYVMNIFGPPPPSEKPLGYVGLTQWLLIAWGYWADRNRNVIEFSY
jgi:hypothetical protein